MIEAIRNTLFTPLGGANGPLGIMMLLNGLGVTLYVTFAATIMGMILGLLTAVMRLGKNKLLQVLAKIYIEIIRGTPVVAQLTIIYFIVFASMPVERTLVAIIAFGINSGAYIAEIIRAGIQAVDRGQMEAAKSLAMTDTTAMKEIILPQALKNILPTLGNEFIILIKETSVIGFIGGVDLMRASDRIRSITYQATIPLITTALIYLVMTMSLSHLLSRLEKRWQKHDRDAH